MLLDAEHAAFLIVDVQSRLLPAIHEGERVAERTVWLARLAEALDIPTVISEHCADKIGTTDAAIRAAAPRAITVHKQDFSVWREGCLGDAVLGGARQIILAGIEAHVCVLQTALDLRRNGYEVFVAAEAVGSRRAEDAALALQRLQQHGCHIVNGEMVAFECLASARHPQFKDIHTRFIR